MHRQWSSLEGLGKRNGGGRIVKDLFNVLCLIFIMQISIHYTMKNFTYVFDKYQWFFLKDFIYLFERERKRVQLWGGTEGEGQVDSTPRVEPNSGLDLMTL